MISEAIKYAQLGFKVLPLTPKSKLPLGTLVPHGHKDATSDILKIRRWWFRYPDANIGLKVGPDSGIVVLDVDPRNGGAESLKRLIDKFGQLPSTVKVNTGGGGTHFYFRYDERFGLPEKFNGIDLKKNGYVVAPASVHESGRRYEWEFLHGLEETTISNLPSWLLSNQPANLKNNPIKTDFSEILDGVEEGNRNNAVARLAGKLFSRGLNQIEVLKIALMANQNNIPPMDEKEVEQIVESIWRKHLREDFSTTTVTTEMTSPEEFFDFMNRDIPPVEFYIPQLIQKEGKTLISAPANVGKSMLAQNLVVALASGAEVLAINNIQKANVLFLDFEMGESAMKKRFEKMRNIGNIDKSRFFLKSVLGQNLLDLSVQEHLSNWIEQFKIQVLILDPISSAWIGNENDRSEVSKLTSFFDTLISKHKVSIVVVHHWRKANKEQNSGGEMAAGSYKWNAWPDIHITLKGEIKSLIIECVKARSTEKFPSYRVSLQPDTLKFEYAGDCLKKFNNDTLMKVFEACGSQRVSLPALIKKAKELNMGSEEVIRSLVKQSPDLEVDSSGKTHYVSIKRTPDSPNA